MDSGLVFRKFLVGDAEAGKPGILELLGMTVEQFAVACGLTRASIYYYLNGKTKPSRETIRKFAKVTGIEFEELLAVLPTREEGRQRGMRVKN
jgi:transcriptional regulator with XRE-family HTH domain